MNQYVTGTIIKELRQNKHMTQSELAEKLMVSDKAISKWENGKGYPDVSLMEPLADALGISVIELMRGEAITNTNRNFNMRKLNFYVCPICGNVIVSSGEALMSCCGVTLLPAEAEEADDNHAVNIDRVEDEYYVTVDHPMEKDHYISFIASVGYDTYEVTKLYPEGSAEARFKMSGTKHLYYYCNRDGLYKVKVKKTR